MGHPGQLPARARVDGVLRRRKRAAAHAGRPGLSHLRLPLPRALRKCASPPAGERRAPERARHPVADPRSGRGGRARARSRHRRRRRRRLVCRGRLFRPAAVAGRGLRRAGRRPDRRGARCCKTRALFAWPPVASCTPSAVVIAAGVDTPRLLPELPIRPQARYLFFSDPIRERLLDPLVVSPERRFAAKQLGDGRLLASDLGAVGDPDVDLDRTGGQMCEAHSRSCCPSLSTSRYRRSWRGSTTSRRTTRRSSAVFVTASGSQRASAATASCWRRRSGGSSPSPCSRNARTLL